MEINLSVNGDPGTGNSFNDTKIRKVDNYNPNAREVNNYYTQSESRLGGWFRRLNDEINNDIRLQKKLDDIKRYHTKLPHTIGLEAKLKDGGFSQSAIDKARRLKMYFAKKSTRFQYYESAQLIDSYLFAKLCQRFDTYILPNIESHPLCDIRQMVYEKVVLPIIDEINANGSYNRQLCYNEDDIYGMLYYLTGKCHINWKDY
ncbi:ABC-three component system protein [uncultured Prevotella sp.]|uniref:ABC-three component system protein n=1 Tax=uncultured Prevotella sp. TaxID=159272 RepID=UPI00260E512A|nr:ABC-three component system protein [uncultured Prevotella sp.]